MYLRVTQHRRKDGRVARYVQLAESERNERGSTVARVIHHFGREDELDLAMLRRLVASIERFLGSETAGSPGAGAASGGEGSEFEFVSSRELGGPHVVAALWAELGVAKTLARLARRSRVHSDVERAILVMVAQRCLEPGSKLAATRWLADAVHVDGIAEVSDDQLYRAMDFLLAHHEAVQQAVFSSVAHLLNLEVDVVFFDTTSTSFEVDEPDSADDDPDGSDDEVVADNAAAIVEGDEAPARGGFRRYGHSKDHRPDLPQVVIGLAVTREGIPVRCWVWPANTADCSVIGEVKRDLQSWQLGRVVVVADAGFSSRENLRTLRRGGGHSICGIRMRSGVADVEVALARPGRYQTVADNLRVKDVLVGDGNARRRYIICHNPQEAALTKTRRDEAIERLTGELAELKTLTGEPHHKQECRLVAHPSLGRYLTQTATGRLAIDHGRIRSEERLDGKYLLETSDLQMPAADVATSYKNLQQAERSFRDTKGQLLLRPVYHRLEERIRSHVLLCFLALLIIRVAETRTEQTWRQIRPILGRLHVGRFQTKDLAFNQRTTLDAEQQSLLRRLNVGEPERIIL